MFSLQTRNGAIWVGGGLVIGQNVNVWKWQWSEPGAAPDHHMGKFIKIQICSPLCLPI